MHREPHNTDAEKIFLLSANNEIKAYITANSITDIYYIVNRYLKNNAKTREVIAKLLSLFRIIEVTESDCKNALVLNIQDYEDALLVACAKRSKMDLIVTRNLKDFLNSNVTAVNPTGFIIYHLKV